MKQYAGIDLVRRIHHDTDAKCHIAVFKDWALEEDHLIFPNEKTAEDLKLGQWKPIPGSKGYEVSNLGRIRRVHKSCVRMLNPFVKRSRSTKSSNAKNLVVTIRYLDNKYKTHFVHQLVYRVFNGEYDNKRFCVFHRNLAHQDNRLFNLELISRNELGKRTGGNTRKKKGIYKLFGNKVYEYYGSSREAARSNYCSYQTILDSCNGKTKENCTGFHFVWANKVDNDFDINKYEFLWQ